MRAIQQFRSVPSLSMEDVDRFWSKVRPPVGIGECWEWMACKIVTGYGRFGKLGEIMDAHRISYFLVNGQISPGFELDHLCRNPGCVNPYHLEAVTKKENILRGEGTGAKFKRRTHCAAGHLLAGDNLDKGDSLAGRRRCKICRNERVRKQRVSKKGVKVVS